MFDYGICPYCNAVTNKINCINNINGYKCKYCISFGRCYYYPHYIVTIENNLKIYYSYKIKLNDNDYIIESQKYKEIFKIHKFDKENNCIILLMIVNRFHYIENNNLDQAKNILEKVLKMKVFI